MRGKKHAISCQVGKGFTVSRLTFPYPYPPRHLYVYETVFQLIILSASFIPFISTYIMQSLTSSLSSLSSPSSPPFLAMPTLTPFPPSISFSSSSISPLSFFCPFPHSSISPSLQSPSSRYYLLSLLYALPLPLSPSLPIPPFTHFLSPSISISSALLNFTLLVRVEDSAQKAARGFDEISLADSKRRKSEVRYNTVYIHRHGIISSIPYHTSL